MSKVIEFKVQIIVVGVGRKKTEMFKAKSFDRLISTFPKQLKKKWVRVTWIENGKEKEVTRDEHIEFNSQR